MLMIYLSVFLVVQIRCESMRGNIPTELINQAAYSPGEVRKADYERERDWKRSSNDYVTTQTYQAGIQKLDRQLADIQVEVDKSGQRIKANLQAIKQEEQEVGQRLRKTDTLIVNVRDQINLFHVSCSSGVISNSCSPNCGKTSGSAQHNVKLPYRHYAYKPGIAAAPSFYRYDDGGYNCYYDQYCTETSDGIKIETLWNSQSKIASSNTAWMACGRY